MGQIDWYSRKIRSSVFRILKLLATKHNNKMAVIYSDLSVSLILFSTVAKKAESAEIITSGLSIGPKNGWIDRNKVKIMHLGQHCLIYFQYLN